MQISLVDLKAQNEMMGDSLKRSINRVIETSSFIKGKLLEEFENNFAKYCGLKFGGGTSSRQSWRAWSDRPRTLPRGEYREH